jgi:hypothetical protein
MRTVISEQRILAATHHQSLSQAHSIDGFGFKRRIVDRALVVRAMVGALASNTVLPGKTQMGIAWEDPDGKTVCEKHCERTDVHLGRHCRLIGVEPLPEAPCRHSLTT